MNFIEAQTEHNKYCPCRCHSGRDECEQCAIAVGAMAEATSGIWPTNNPIAPRGSSREGGEKD